MRVQCNTRSNVKRNFHCIDFHENHNSYFKLHGCVVYRNFAHISQECGKVLSLIPNADGTVHEQVKDRLILLPICMSLSECAD